VDLCQISFCFSDMAVRAQQLIFMPNLRVSDDFPPQARRKAAFTTSSSFWLLMIYLQNRVVFFTADYAFIS